MNELNVFLYYDSFSPNLKHKINETQSCITGSAVCMSTVYWFYLSGTFKHINFVYNINFSSYS